MRALLPAVVAMAIGCAATRPPPDNADSVVVQVSALPTASAALVQSAPEAEPYAEPAPAAEDSSSSVIGAWSWNDDVATYNADGTGNYVRASSLCFRFAYTVTEGVLTQHADRDHTCGAHRTASYRVEVLGDTLTMTHIGSGFVSNWERR